MAIPNRKPFDRCAGLDPELFSLGVRLTRFQVHG